MWKLWVENKTAQGRERMNTMVRCLVLRRTKSQKSTLTGKDLVELPAKHVQEHRIALGQEERRVYQEVFNFAKGAMETYMARQKEKDEDAAWRATGELNIGQNIQGYRSYWLK